MRKILKIVIFTLSCLISITKAYSSGPPKICWHCQSLKTGHGGRPLDKRLLPINSLKINHTRYQFTRPDKVLKDKEKAPLGDKTFEIYKFKIPTKLPKHIHFFRGFSIQFRAFKDDYIAGSYPDQNSKDEGQPIGEFQVDAASLASREYGYVDCRDCFDGDLKYQMTAKSCLTHRSGEDKNLLEFEWMNRFNYKGKVVITGTIVKSYREYWENIGIYEFDTRE